MPYMEERNLDKLMKYLFFDIECANCFDGRGKICEFGYVLTDEAFNEIESKEIIINPNSSFDPYVINKVLHYTSQIYRAEKDYSHHYDDIKRLFEIEDLIIVGHTVSADAKYLNDEAIRYKKPFFNYKFYDAKNMYSTYTDTQGAVSLEKISQKMGNQQKHTQHRAVDDALTTMFIVKEMCKSTGYDLSALIANCNDCEGETKNGKIRTSEQEIAKKRKAELLKNITNPKNALQGENYTKFKQFLLGVKPQGKIIKSELNGKGVTVTLNYQIGHYKEMLSLVQLLKNHDCDYKLKASDCNYMVTKTVYNEDGTERYCSKSVNLRGAVKNGADIKFISFDELLALLGVKEEDLSKMPYPKREFFVSTKPDINSSIESSATNIGDIFKATALSKKQAQ